MSFRVFVLFIFLMFYTLGLCFSVDDIALNSISEALKKSLNSGDILIFSELEGNYANDFSKKLISFLEKEHNVNFVDYDIQKDVLLKKIKFSEPVYINPDLKLSESLEKPKYMLNLKANINFDRHLLVRRESLGYELTIINIDNGIIQNTIKDFFILKQKISVVFIISIIVIILLLARLIIFLNKGYNVKPVFFITSLSIIIVIAWYLLS